MIELLDVVGPAIWRASWQAAILASLVAVLIGCFGDRVTPRWRYLLWSVVIVRLLLVITPGSPWSMFNLANQPRETTASHFDSEVNEDSCNAQPPVAVTPDFPIARLDVALRQESKPPSRLPVAEPVVSTQEPTVAPSTLLELPNETAGAASFERRAFSVRRALSLIWLIGCILLVVRLLVAVGALWRRLRACRPVTDPVVLEMLESLRQAMGVRRSVRLLVTPETVSPYVAGAWRAQIVVPESLLTGQSEHRLQQVFAHELAHVARGDLWMNWLLLAARTLHWFNPAAWWSVRAMQAEREAACDEMAIGVLHGSERGSYVETILELASSLAPPPMAPGMISLFSSRRTLRSRMERILRPPTSRPMRSAVVGGLLLLLTLLGLTDAMPRGVEVEPAESAAATSGQTEAASATKSPAADYAVRGTCTDGADGTPLAGVRLTLVAIRGLVGPAENVAETASDDQGRFEFSGLNSPKPENELNRLTYGVVAEAEGRPTAFGDGWMWGLQGQDMEIPMGREIATLNGRVVDEAGKPVAGATVARHAIRGRPVLDACSAVTDVNGMFSITSLPALPMCFHSSAGKLHATLAEKSSPDTLRKTRCYIFHPAYPMCLTPATELPGRVECTLPPRCMLSGTVMDGVTGQPASGVVVCAQGMKSGVHAYAETDAAGHYVVAVTPGSYNILAQTEDRVCVAIADHECPAGESITLPRLKLIRGGLIAGRVINTATGKSETKSEKGQPIMVGLFGPSRPVQKVTSAAWLAEVDRKGRFVLRAAPGENYPYLVNRRGSRTIWDTRRQDPLVVLEGETVETEILITPPVLPEEKMAAARKILAALTVETSQRVEGILEEFRKLNHTVDETEIWCLLMRELVTIGSDAVPQLCAELDATTEQRMIRRLAVALRAIGDPHAVPALIRAIPKTLQPPMSDYGLLVEDADLTTFMQSIDLGNDHGKVFGLGRPVREIVAALHKLTRQAFQDDTLFSIRLSDGHNRQQMQRHIYQQRAESWQQWWEAHWLEFTDDQSYRLVNLPAVAPSASESSVADPKPRIGTGGISGLVLSPFTEKGKYVDQFLDLDTGLQPNWPANISQEESAADTAKLAQWAKRTGVDLMCVIHRSDDGTSTYALRAFDMRVREISLWDAENIEKRLKVGKIPEGRPVGDLVMHYDAATKKYVPEANAAFIYVTREGGMGLIHVTDRVIRKTSLTGKSDVLVAAGDPTPGVGFQKGVRFTHRVIVQ